MSPEDNTAYDVLLERIETVRDDAREIKSSVKCLDQNYRAFREEYTRGHVQVESSIERAHERIDENEEAIGNLRKAVEPLVPTYKVLLWIGGALGTSVLVLIWMLITGQVQLLF